MIFEQIYLFFKNKRSFVSDHTKQRRKVYRSFVYSTLQLVKSDVHIATIPHSGSVKQYEATYDVKYKP